MSESEIDRLKVLTVLVAFLWPVVFRRRRSERARATEFRRNWKPRTFDSSVLPRIERLREDYVGAYPSRAQPPGRHRELIARARRAIVSMSYFRRASAGELKHDTPERHP
jgi:hypothetical protein